MQALTAAYWVVGCSLSSYSMNDSVSILVAVVLILVALRWMLGKYLVQAHGLDAYYRMV